MRDAEKVEIAPQKAAPRRQRPLDVVMAVAFGGTIAIAVLILGSGVLEGVPEPLHTRAELSLWALTAFVLCGAGAAAWLIARGARALAMRFAVLTSVVGLGVLFLLSKMAPTHVEGVLTASDRDPMREGRLHDGGEGIEHAHLQFRLPHPDMPFLPAPYIEEEAFAQGGEAYRAHHALFAFQGDASEGEGGETTIMVDLSPGTETDEAALDVLTESALAPLRRSGHEVSQTTATVMSTCARRIAHGELHGEGAGGHVDLLLAVFRDPIAPRTMRLAITVVSEAGGWEGYLERVELPCETR